MASIQSASSRTNVLQVMGNSIVGGMEHCVLRLIQNLPRERFGVSVLCPCESRFTDRLRGLGCEVVTAVMPPEPVWSSIQLGAALVRCNAIDVIHAHLPNAHLLAGLVGKLTGKPVLATIHGRQLTLPDLEAQRGCGTQLNVVCKPTYFHALALGVNPSALHLIPNGVDTTVFAPRRSTVSALRERFAIAPAAPLIGFVGRLSPEKGPEVFLRAALALRETCPQAHFIVVGEGPMSAELSGFIERSGLGGNVHLAGLQEDMPGVYAQLDIVVSSSHAEAMPLALMEAMACGLPVIATRVGGVPDLVQHGVNGWLVSDGDHEGIGHRVRALVDDPALRATMGGCGRERAVERLSLADSVHSMARLLARLAQPRAEPRRISAVINDAKLPLAGKASSA